MGASASLSLETKEDRRYATFLHLAPLAGLLLNAFLHLPGPNIAIALALWLIGKRRSSFIDHCGRNALNFQITLLIYLGLLTALTLSVEKLANNPNFFVVYPWRLRLMGGSVMALSILGPLLAIGLMITAARKASRGIAWEYPFAVGFIRRIPSLEERTP